LPYCDEPHPEPALRKEPPSRRQARSAALPSAPNRRNATKKLLPDQLRDPRERSPKNFGTVSVWVLDRQRATPRIHLSGQKQFVASLWEFLRKRFEILPIKHKNDVGFVNDCRRDTPASVDRQVNTEFLCPRHSGFWRVSGFCHVKAA
jgi:hypothetical protein